MTVGLADAVGEVGPGAVFDLLEVSLVLGVEDDGVVGALPDDVRDEGALGAGVGGLPLEGDDRLALASRPDRPAVLAGQGVDDALHPRLETLLHRERPREALELAEAGESARFDGPLEGADAGAVVVAAPVVAPPLVELAARRASRFDVADPFQEPFAEREQALHEGTGPELGLERPAVALQGVVDGRQQVAVVGQVGMAARHVEHPALGDALGGVGLPVDSAAGRPPVALDHLEVALGVDEQRPELGEDDAREDPGANLAVRLGEFGAFPNSYQRGGHVDRLRNRRI